MLMVISCFDQFQYLASRSLSTPRVPGVIARRQFPRKSLSSKRNSVPSKVRLRGERWNAFNEASELREGRKGKEFD